METLECILQRRSIRKFKSEKLTAELAGQIIEYAKFVPSWSHTKTTRYTFVQDDVFKSKLAGCVTHHNRVIIENAPNLFILTAMTGRSGYERNGAVVSHTPEEWLMFDSGIAAQTLCLAAKEFSVGTVILGGFSIPEITALLQLPEDQVLVTVIAAGYPDEEPVVPKRKELSEILRVI